jgi:hypothetical protein
MNATSSGPMVAPVWSNASCSPKPQPWPVRLAAWESMASRNGERIARPKRSAIISAAAVPTPGASASSGTENKLIV